MSTCEKCLSEAAGDSRLYNQLIDNRHCSAEESAGPDARRCPVWGRMTIHQYTGECMVPGCAG